MQRQSGGWTFPLLLFSNIRAAGIHTLLSRRPVGMTRDLSRLLRPRSIAVIGGGAISRYLIENCAKIGFARPLWHVHPTRGEFVSVQDLPTPPDVAFVGVNRAATTGIVAELAAMGAGGAVAYASGFAEAAAELADGGDLQAELVKAAGEMVLIGPNCYGFLNYLDGAALWPDQQGGQRCETGVAIITQSSNIAINLTMQRRGVPLAYLVTAGNQAQTGLGEIGQFLLEDPRVTALGLHIEGIGDLRAFEALAAKAQALGKPIVVLKAGASEQAQTAAISHTASLAGSAAGASALLRRLGIAQVGSLSVLLETLKLCHVVGPLKSNRIASMSCSGGEASLMADAAVGHAIAYPPLNAQQTQALRTALGPRVALANPLDYHTYIWANVTQMTAAYSAMMTGDLALGVVVADFPRNDRCSDVDWDPVIQAVAATAKASGKPMAILSSIAENLSEATAVRLIASGIVPLNGIDAAISAIEAAAVLGQSHCAPAPLVLPGAPSDVEMIEEGSAKALLRKAGVIVPKAVTVSDIKDLSEAVELVGFPLVLKGMGLAHKTEAGAVALGLTSLAEVERAAALMPVTQFLVEEMITGAVAELLIGIVRDPAHGMLLTLAAGGTFTELLQDRASLLLPVEAEDIRAALMSLRMAPVLHGYRGAAGANIEAIVEAVLAIQIYVMDHPGQIDEIEINPLICTATRAVAADVLLRIGRSTVQCEQKERPDEREPR